jgi:hypothetical protein
VVVTVAIRLRGHARKILRATPRAGVLFTGIAFLPTQSGSISLSPPGVQLRAIEGLSSESQPSLNRPSLYGNFLPPAAAPDEALTFGFSWSAVGLTEPLGIESSISASLNGAVPDYTDQFGGGDTPAGSAATIGSGTPAAARTVCEPFSRQLQRVGEYWNDYSIGGSPVKLAGNLASDPTRGPTGDSPNVLPQGPAGAWCRPPLPFADSSPLASRAFWTPIILVLSAVGVLWLSRGVRLPP